MPQDTKTRRRAGFARRYESRLRAFVADGTKADMAAAQAIGRLGVSIGYKTLDLARIHEEALTRCGVMAGRSYKGRRSDLFFNEALTPCIKAHAISLNSKKELRKLKNALKHRTTELATAHRHLRKGIRRRKQVESDLIRSGEHYAKLLKKSLILQDGLRHLTHKVLAAQEKERLKISRELQNELGQTLLGINVRLLSLRHEARTHSSGLHGSITDTQQLIKRSAHRARRAAGGRNSQ